MTEGKRVVIDGGFAVVDVEPEVSDAQQDEGAGT